LPEIDRHEPKAAVPTDLQKIVSYLLNRVSHRYNQTVHSKMREAGLTVMNARVIVCLKIFGELTVNDLCVHAIAEQSTVSHALDRMANENLISRHIGERDSRVRVVRLTPDGEAMYDKIWPVMAAANEELLKGVSQPDRKVFTRVLTHVLKNIRKHPI